MTNMEIAAGAPVVRRDANNVEVTFPKVNSGRLLTLMSKWAKEDRQKLIDDYKESGISGEPLLKALRDIDADCTQPAYGFYECMTNLARATDVLAASLGTETLPTLGDAEEPCWVAAELWNQPMYRRARFPTAEELEERRAASAPKGNGQLHTTGSSTAPSFDESIPEPTLTR